MIQRALIYVLLVFSFTAPSFGAVPTLLFSDAENAPVSGWDQSATKGAAVSIWGLNLGSTRGTAYVTCGGVNLTSESDYAEWGAVTNPTTARGLQRITFWLNSSMSIGSTSISVTNADGTSQSIPFYTRVIGSNHIYFLDNVSGNDSNPGSLALPKKTTAWLRQYLTSGDCAYIRYTGTDYTDHDNTGLLMYDYGGLMSFQTSGTTPNHNNGVVNNSIYVTSYPGENPLLDATTDNEADGFTIKSCIRAGNFGTALRYWTFSKLSMVASYSTFELGSANATYGALENFRIVGCDLTTDATTTTQWGNGITAYGNAGGANGLFILGTYIHDIKCDYRGEVGALRAYPIYVGGYGQLNRIFIRYNEFGWLSQGRGVQIYGHLGTDRVSNLHYSHNYTHDAARQCLIFGGGDNADATPYPFMTSGYCYSNIFEFPSEDDPVVLLGGVGWGRYGGNLWFNNNTLYTVSPVPPLNITNSLDSFSMQNNIVIGSSDLVDASTDYPDTTGPAGDYLGDHNLFYLCDLDSTDNFLWEISTLIGLNPLITGSPVTLSGAFSTYSLDAGSPAISAGVSLSEMPVDYLMTDFYGNSWGVTPSIGAVEYSTGDFPTYDSPTITGPDDFSTTSTSVEINGSYTNDPNLPDQSVVITWTLGEASGFAVAALGVFTCTVPDLGLGTNSIVFEITDSNSGAASDTTVVTRTLPATSTVVTHGNIGLHKLILH